MATFFHRLCDESTSLRQGSGLLQWFSVSKLFEDTFPTTHIPSLIDRRGSLASQEYVSIF